MTSELVDEALRTMLALNSVRIDCTSALNGEAVQNSRSARYTLILAGEDYHQSGDIEYGGEVAEHVRAILGEPRECLNYRGVEYVRDPRYGDWLKTLPDAYRNQHMSSFSVTVSDNVEQPFSEEEYKRRHLVFGTEPRRMKTYRVIGTEAMDGLSLAHVRGEHSESARLDRMPSPDDLAMSAVMTSEALENYKKLRANMPDRVHSSLDIWVDGTTHFIHRLEWLDEGLRDERIVHTNQGTRLYSLFNTAELPDPLPE